MRTTFDVICVGEVTWRLDPKGLRPSSGSINVALRLRREGLRVGLATVLDDDENGRATRARVAEKGIDVEGVTLASAVRSNIVVVDGRGDASELVPALEAKPPFSVPEGWSASIVFLSGITPVVAHAAALCRAARRARRDGALVVIDFNAALHTRAGRDARTIRMLLREVDIARCSTADLAVIGSDVETVREALRASATLVVSEPDGRVTATGPFGEVVYVPERADVAFFEAGGGDALMTSICREMLDRPEPGESVDARWYRALRRGHVSRDNPGSRDRASGGDPATRGRRRALL